MKINTDVYMLPRKKLNEFKNITFDEDINSFYDFFKTYKFPFLFESVSRFTILEEGNTLLQDKLLEGKLISVKANETVRENEIPMNQLIKILNIASNNRPDLYDLVITNNGLCISTTKNIADNIMKMQFNAVVEQKSQFNSEFGKQFKETIEPEFMKACKMANNDENKDLVHELSYVDLYLDDDEVIYLKVEPSHKSTWRLFLFDDRDKTLITYNIYYDKPKYKNDIMERILNKCGVGYHIIETINNGNKISMTAKGFVTFFEYIISVYNKRISELKTTGNQSDETELLTAINFKESIESELKRLNVLIYACSEFDVNFKSNLDKELAPTIRLIV